MTYSIVARDPATGELGVAVQSHYFGVGTLCPWARAGVGAVATQSIVDPSYGPLGLTLLHAGRTAAQALDGLVAADPRADLRQVAIVDATGAVAAHTGSRCIAHAGHVAGDGFSVQANMMRNDTVCEAMGSAYQAGLAAGDDLATRLLAALDAAESEGGDIRGRQSAALVVVAAEGSGQPWRDVRFDVRVDDHAEPLTELRRLVSLRRAYALGDAGDEAIAAGDVDRAFEHFQAASALAPDNVELRFWFGVSLATAGHVVEARSALAPALAEHVGWAELLRRLPASNLFPDDPALIDRLLSTD